MPSSHRTTSAKDIFKGSSPFRVRPKRAYVDFSETESHGRHRKRLLITVPGDAHVVDYHDNKGGWKTIYSDHSVKVRWSKKDMQYLILVKQTMDACDLQNFINSRLWTRRRRACIEHLRMTGAVHDRYTDESRNVNVNHAGSTVSGLSSEEWARKWMEEHK